MKKACNSTSLLMPELCWSLFFLINFEVALMANQNGESWKLISEIGTKDWFTSIYFVNRQTGWVSTSGGKIFHTKDGAKTWEEQYSPTTVRLNDLKFVNQDVGWAVGFNDTVLHTTNGGLSWITEMTDSNQPKGAFGAVFFLDESTGWIAGNRKRTLRTTNKGISWIPGKYDAPTAISTIHFSNQNDGWAASLNRILIKTNDGGENWMEVDLNEFPFGGTVVFSDVVFPNTSRGFVGLNRMFSSDSVFLKNGPSLLHTRDGGLEWHIAQIKDLEPGQTFIEFGDEKTGWLGSGKSILRTTDGGETWHYQVRDLDYINDLTSFGSEAAWALSFKGKVYGFNESKGQE